jgi:hypothetical protein
MQFPAYFSANCPPATAQPASGTVYYLVNSEPLTPEDFWSKRQRNPDKRFSQKSKECQACGISVYTDIEDVLLLRREIQSFQNHQISVGQLIPEMGVILPTPSEFFPSHRTLWLAVGSQPWLLFHISNEFQ